MYGQYEDGADVLRSLVNHLCAGPVGRKVGIGNYEAETLRMRVEAADPIKSFPLRRDEALKFR